MSQEADVKKLRELTVKRSSIKGQITKFNNFVDKLSSEDSLTNIEIAELKIKLGRFEQLSARFDELQSQIEVLNSGSLSLELEERDKIESDLVSGLAAAKGLLDISVPSCSHECNESRSEPRDSDIRLPRIQISKFNGAYFNWLEFRDSFLNLVDHNKQLSPVHKFHYLISYLEGDAARIISNLEVSTENYKEAWKLLCDRYDNKRLLIDHHMNSLFNMRPISRETVKSLRFLVDHVTKNLRALSSLGMPTDNWDMCVIFNLTSKLDHNTLLKWEEFRNQLGNNHPTLENFKQVLINRADVLEALERNKTDNSCQKGFQVQNNQNRSFTQINHNNKLDKYPRVFIKAATASNKDTSSSFVCIICSQNHKIYECPTFKEKTIQEKWADVNKYKLCPNCLKQGHPAKACGFGSCPDCKQRHNRLLHNPSQAIQNNHAHSESESINVNSSEYQFNHILLSTALIQVHNPNNNQYETVRALLDCGSQGSFITKSLKDKLSLDSIPITSLNVIGIGNNLSGTVEETCTVKLQSIYKQFDVTYNMLIMNDLTGYLPKNHININFRIPKHIKLADPKFNEPSQVDVLIGCDLFWDILGNEEISIGSGNLKLRNSKLGWFVAGPINKNNLNSTYCNSSIITKNNKTQESCIDKLLTKFWEIEELPNKPILSERERVCEKHFMQNTVRLSDGRFNVKLPLNSSPNNLGESYNTAKKRLFNLESRFRKNPTLKSQYVDFMKEYEELGHMSVAPKGKPFPSYFLCHHAVFKDNSESTKVRVVFDGSVPTSSGISVNDILMVGPNIQDSLFSILIRARQYKYLITGDIEKMYRQVRVDESCRNLQLILWREDESLPIRTMQMNTLTYGTTSASYLSTRCLWQVGEECGDETIKNIIQHDFYVDDLITGCDDEKQLSDIQHSISAALKSACLNLRKYKTNSKNLFKNSCINTQDKLTISEASSTLGLGWDPKSDNLNFPVQPYHNQDSVTKRRILSTAFKIFDPLGLLSPCIITAKIILQNLWKQKIDWDQAIPHELAERWLEFANNLNCLLKLQIPRRVLCDSPNSIEFHSFSDASQKAYGACVYVRSTENNCDFTVRLLAAKSKVARINPMTIPRLELCAALLAAKLCKSVLESVRYRPSRIVHWCDSSVVLAWLRGDPTKLKTFVANRVVEITELTDAFSWRYVPTDMNPADLISRGINIDQIINNSLWWSGPNYLINSDCDWPVLNSIDIHDIPETKITSKSKTTPKITNKTKYLHKTVQSAPLISSLASTKQADPSASETKTHKTINSLITPNKTFEINTYLNTDALQPIIDIEKYSKLNKLIRIVAWVKRFCFNIRNPHNKPVLDLSANELDDSFLYLCRVAQIKCFPIEYKALSKKLPINIKSKLLSLSPFLDDNNLIRVGGRINASPYSFDKKHPILLDSSHHLTKLLFEREHLRHMHAGPLLLLSMIRESVWPLNGRRLARRIVHNCVRCCRVRGKTLCPKMGDLPSQRVSADFPFNSVGIDFAGPFYIINRKGKGARINKCYLCIFVCLRYKCVHLEAVCDLTKDAFVMTLRRFIARRGKPNEIFCDNGGNFVAAAKEIGAFLKLHNRSLTEFATHENIKFVFSPAHAPHFGGIWEAGVKSAKFHIKRVMGNSHLTFEEISTLFAQVEAVLNSRPLCPLSSSPDDYLPLSPGHFLIGRPLKALPEPSLENLKESHLQRYSRLQQIHQHFWSRWQREYIHELQQRLKWKTNTKSLRIGDLVLIHEDHVPPLCWRLGRVTKLFPGPDGVSRVADLKTIRGVLRRPIIKLCPLPTAEDLMLKDKPFNRWEDV